MSNFDTVWQRKQEIAGRPYANELYYRTFKTMLIKRFEGPDNYTLDKHYAIDVTITLPNKMVILGQEKFLSDDYAHYGTVTVEYEQDQFTHEPGDWFKLACQFYFCGYRDPKCTQQFKPWIILNWPSVVIATNNREIAWRTNANGDGHARASFLHCPMSKFPKSCVIAGSF